MISSSTSISVTLILSIISSIGVLVTIFSTVHKQHDAEAERRLDLETNFTQLNTKLDIYSSSSEKMMTKLENTEEKISAINTRLTSVETQTHTLFKYKDDHEDRIKELEHVN